MMLTLTSWKTTTFQTKVSYFQHIWTLKHISSLASFSSKYRSKQKQICYWIFAMTAHDWTIYRAMDLHMQIPGHTKCQCRICTYRYEVPKVIQYINVWWNTIEVESWSVVYFYTFRVVFSHRIVTPCSMLLTLCLSPAVIIQAASLSLKGIRKFYHFYSSTLMPGIVLCSVDADNEKVPVVLRKDLPSEIRPGGLSRERERDLYKNIGASCSRAVQKHYMSRIERKIKEHYYSCIPSHTCLIYAA